jgi:hypothetical protein
VLQLFRTTFFVTLWPNIGHFGCVHFLVHTDQSGPVCIYTYQIFCLLVHTVKIKPCNKRLQKKIFPTHHKGSQQSIHWYLLVVNPSARELHTGRAQICATGTPWHHSTNQSTAQEATDQSKCADTCTPWCLNVHAHLCALYFMWSYLAPVRHGRYGELQTSYLYLVVQARNSFDITFGWRLQCEGYKRLYGIVIRAPDSGPRGPLFESWARRIFHDLGNVFEY